MAIREALAQLIDRGVVICQAAPEKRPPSAIKLPVTPLHQWSPRTAVDYLKPIPLSTYSLIAFSL